MQYPDDGELVSRFSGWPSSMSRIVRVSRATGGKDRHSKVLTSKGLRDRRVRLSVSTAIQFYDLQDRLGYDQPSKAVEWLIKAAASSIDELPSLNSPFPDSPKQEENMQRSLSLSKSTCSSTSETSRGSSLSLSRTESRVKARERARGRAANRVDPDPNPNQTSSFTELLTGQNQREWSMESCFDQSRQIQFGNPIQNQELQIQQFSFVPENLVPTDLNFSGYNRGTLQSNSSSLSSMFSNLPFFMGNAAPASGFDGGLHLCYGDGNRRSDQIGKGKN